MDEIKASPVVNPRMAALAKLLRAGRDIGNKATFSPSMPLVGGQGMGDLVLGKAPEEVENWGYGNMPVRMPEMSNVPMVKTGRKDGLADAIGMLPFAGGDSMQAIIHAIRSKNRDVVGDLVGEVYDRVRKEGGTPRQLRGTRQMINAVDDPGRLITSTDPQKGLRGAASYDVDKDSLYLQNIGSAYPGAGSEMMDWIERLAQKRKIPVRLHSDPDAVGFYEKRGYTRTGNYSDSYDLDLANPEYIKKF
jgi:hypothetical protein